MRVQVRWMLWTVLKLLSCRMRDEDLAKSAVVFSPHPDDETLGCGGTVIRKRKVGAKVKIVFMTDGSASHRRYMPEEELKKLRTDEASSACAVLGIEKRNVIFLNFKDQELEKYQSEARSEVVKILSSDDIDHIFIPFKGDVTTDHEITNSIVLSAAKSLGKKLVVYEYPIWLWHHWPWIKISTLNWSQMLRELNYSFRSWITLVRRFHSFVPVNDVLELKRVALNEHRTQLNRLLPNSEWPTLHDVSNGEFLQCFFRGGEFFHKYELSNDANSSGRSALTNR